MANSIEGQNILLYLHVNEKTPHISGAVNINFNELPCTTVITVTNNHTLQIGSIVSLIFCSKENPFYYDKYYVIITEITDLGFSGRTTNLYKYGDINYLLNNCLTPFDKKREDELPVKTGTLISFEYKNIFDIPGWNIV